MKTITPIIFLIYLLAACSPENTDPTLVPRQASLSLKDGVAMPDNPANSYDFTGGVYTDLLDSYYAQSPNASSLPEVISAGESLAFQNAGFLSLREMEGYTITTVSKVQPYLEPKEDITSLLSSGYSENSRNILLEISQNLTFLKQSDANYEQAYTMLVDIEASINGNTLLSSTERIAMLTTTSILRNALYHDTKRKRRDRDWEWMIGNIAATANAALDSKADAIMMSFATDVYHP